MKKIICVIFSLVLAVSVGMYSGLKYTEKILKNNDYIKEQISDVIAVVNLDDGVEVNGETLYYSSSLIAELGEGYSIESSAGAQEGMRAGKYGAIITFPSNTSSCIESVNSASPVQLQIDYSINENLDSNSYVGIVSKIADFRNRINNMISYTYVVSIISSLHDAQDTADQLISNNESVLTALDELELMDYVDSLELGSIPALDFQPEDLEIDTYLSEANSYANDVSNYYLASYQDAQNDFDAVQAALNDNSGVFNEQLTAYLDELRGWRTDAVALNTDVSDYSGYLRDYCDQLEAGRADLNANITSFNRYLQAYKDQYISLGTWQAGLDSFFRSTLSRLNDLNGRIQTFQRDYNDPEDQERSLEQLISNYNDALFTYEQSLDAYISYLEDRVQSQPQPQIVEEVPSEIEPDPLGEAEQGSVTGDEDVVDSEDEVIEDDLSSVTDAAMQDDTIVTDDAQQESLQHIDIPDDDIQSESMDTADSYGDRRQDFIDARNELYSAANALITAVERLKTDADNVYIAYSNYSNAAYDSEGRPRIPEYAGPDNGGAIINVQSSDINALMAVPVPSMAPELEQYTQDELPAWHEEIDQASSELIRLSSSYNPLDYLSTSVSDQIASRYARFSSYSAGVESQINSAYDLNVGRMQTELGRYTTYVNNMRNTAIDTYNEEQEAFTDSVTSYGDEIRAINERNNELIGSFVSLMPESRTGSDINTGVVDAIVEPIGFKSDSAPMTAETTSFGNVTSKLVYVMAGSGVLAAVMLVWVAVDSIKKRRV